MFLKKKRVVESTVQAEHNDSQALSWEQKSCGYKKIVSFSAYIVRSKELYGFRKWKPLSKSLLRSDFFKTLCSHKLRAKQNLDDKNGKFLMSADADDLLCSKS